MLIISLGIYLFWITVSILLLFFCWMHMVANVQIGKVDALIVLGYRSDNGEVHPLLKERLDVAVQLFLKHDFKYLLVSGGAVAFKRSEAEIMRDYLIQQGGIAPESIIMETDSRNTVQNAVNCSLLLRRYGLVSCLFVSNSFHIRRMRFIMRRLNIPASFYAKRDIRSIVGMQWRLTFQEIRAFRLTLPWINKALVHDSSKMMGNERRMNG